MTDSGNVTTRITLPLVWGRLVKTKRCSYHWPPHDGHYSFAGFVACERLMKRNLKSGKWAVAE